MTETNLEYHEKSRSGEFISYHMLAKYRECPRHYKLIIDGEAPEDADTPAFRLGRAAHCLILEGAEKFHSVYSANAPLNPKTGRPYGIETQKFAEWQAGNPGVEYIDLDDMSKISKMFLSVYSLPSAAKLLQHGEPEKIFRAEYLRMPCQIRFDYLVAENGTGFFVDLKTCQDLTWFEHDAKRFKYANQFAFYQSVYHAATGETLDVYCVAVETKFPYSAGIWKISDDTLAMARAENESTMVALADSRVTGVYPTGYERIRVM